MPAPQHSADRLRQNGVALDHSADWLLEKVALIFGDTMGKQRITMFWVLGAPLSLLRRM